MPFPGFNRFWTIVVVFLSTVIIVASLIIWTKYRPGSPLEIILPPEQEISGSIYIDGAVNNPGIYPFLGEDSLKAVIQSAGGVPSDGNSYDFKLTVLPSDLETIPQKVNINTAGAWLLEALPGIGSAKAEAIIRHREENGFFKNINELTDVDGISETLLEQIKPLIAVSD